MVDIHGRLICEDRQGRHVHLGLHIHISSQWFQCFFKPGRHFVRVTAADAIGHDAGFEGCVSNMCTVLSSELSRRSMCGELKLQMGILVGNG